MTSVTAAAESAHPLSSVAAARIRGLRAEAGLTQTELAREVGLSRTAISDREGGVKPVNVDELPTLAAVLGTSIEYLLGLTNDRSPRPAMPAEGSRYAMRDLNPQPADLAQRPGLRLITSARSTRSTSKGYGWAPRVINGGLAS